MGDCKLMDDYKLEQYPKDHFDYIIDIGACIGDVTCPCAEKNPNAEIISYEPCKISFSKLIENTIEYNNVTVINEALGDGGYLYFKELGRIDQHMFVKIDVGGYKIQSRTLSEIFAINNIDISKKYALKMDCEGGEEYLIGSQESENIMIGCDHIAMEIHFKPKGERNVWFNVLPKFEFYRSWVYDVFGDTHSIWYGRSSGRHGHGIYVLEKKLC